MNDATPLPPDDDATTDPVLADAGAQLRAGAGTLRAADIEVAALRRRARRRGLVAGAAAAVAVVALVGAAFAVAGRDDGDRVAGGGDGGGGPSVDRLVASLAAEPVDPTEVRLVSSVQTFPGCDALVADLRRVGAEHVGSRGFGVSWGTFTADEARSTQAASLNTADSVVSNGSPAGETLGTNVQVTGVDELDHVKADATWIYDLDGHGNLRITDATSLQPTGSVRIIPDPTEATDEFSDPYQSLSSLLVHDGRIAVFGSKTVTSAPVAGDPSATRASTEYLTVTFVDASDPAKPTVTDQVDIEGGLVSARLVDGQIRLVTTSNMADLGFVLPTTPTSVAKALDRNRRSVAASNVDDWIPDWQRSGGSAQRLVPCERVHVPTTFAGVAMTSLVSFPIGTGRFAPEATSILAPGDTLYAGVEDVAISSHVWVDPADRQRLDFDDWQTAVHAFSFTDDGAPAYEGSGIVDGSTVGQFAFGQIGDALGVVTTTGTPWSQDTTNAVDLEVLTPDGSGALTRVAEVADLAGGEGMVSAVRFMDGRVLVSTGTGGTLVRVIDTTDPAHPRRAGTITLPGPTGYFHPLGEHRALLIGSRTDRVQVGDETVGRQWVVAQLLDVADADGPTIAGSWETPWAGDQVAGDHHAFTWWASKRLAMWGIQTYGYDLGQSPNHAAVLAVDGGLTERAMPEASPPPEEAAPCSEVAIDDADLRDLVGDDGVVLACGDRSQTRVEWPRYTCYLVGSDMVRHYAPDLVDTAAVFLCNPAPLPTVSRVLVVDGRPILLTDQTLEELDPDTFAARRVVYHPTTAFSGMPGW